MIDCFNFRPRYTEVDLIVMEKMHTKQLLKERDRCYSGGCSGNYYTSNSPECQACIANQDYNLKQVKKLLATREHIPNKKEAKEIRKQKIRVGV